MNEAANYKQYDKRLEDRYLADKRMLRVMYANMGKPNVSLDVLNWDHMKIINRAYVVRARRICKECGDELILEDELALNICRGCGGLQ